MILKIGPFEDYWRYKKGEIENLQLENLLKYNLERLISK